MNIDKLKQTLKKREAKQKKERHLHDIHVKQRAERSFADGWISNHGFKTYHDLSDNDWQRLKHDFNKYEKQFQSQHVHNLHDKYHRKTEQDAKQHMSPYKGKDNRSRKHEAAKHYKHNNAISHDPQRRSSARDNLRSTDMKAFLKARNSVKQLHRRAAEGDPRAKIALYQRREATIDPKMPGLRSSANFLNKHLFHTSLNQLGAKKMSQKYPDASQKTGFSAFFTAIFEGVGIMNRRAMSDPLLDAFSPLGFKRRAKIHAKEHQFHNDQHILHQHSEEKSDNEQAKINARARALNRARMAGDDELQS